VLGYDELILARIYVIFVSFCPEFLEKQALSAFVIFWNIKPFVSFCPEFLKK
jgi:hypothetical protein